jgi:hypothetical protein
VYSPRITTVEELSYQRDGADSPGYDEWYVFDAPPAELGEITRESPFVETHAPRPGRLTVLVNYSAFVIHDIDSAVQFIVEIFWRQLEWVQPCAYVADGPSHLTFVCTNRQLFDSVFQRLNAALTK